MTYTNGHKRDLERRRSSVCTRHGFLGGLLVLVPMLFCAGCANLAGPEYTRPEAPTKQGWSEQPSEVARGTEIIEPEWWKNFQDPYLDQLIAQALKESIDIQILTARIDVARGGVTQAEAVGQPRVGGSSGIDHFSFTDIDSTTRYSLAAEASWEIDIWGKIRKGVEAQQAEYHATEADWRAGYLTLVADVASRYFEIRQLDEQSQRHALSLQRNREILEIYQGMFREGLIPETQVMQQKAEVNRLQRELLEFARLRKISENGLATLVGMPADTLRVPEAPLRTVITAPEVPAGLPSQLLARRPDILAAEYRVLQSHNLAGQARLARLPSINLTGRAGTAGFSLGDLFDAATFGLASALTFPIFDPNLKAQIKVADAQTKVAEQEYRRSVITAFEEVENALTNLSSRKQQKLQLEARERQLSIVSEQIKAQLNEGLASQLEVFEVERSLLDAEQQLLINQWEVLTDTIALYKSLGGGWSEEVVGRSETNNQ
ncbi:MAG: efflux transporter outer membrane subunit [Candidatus Thiodiazotropha sp.]